ncbi:hypothetical protein ACROYT_G006998 [Oculina patagonica]
MNSSTANQTDGPGAPNDIVYMTEPLGLRIFRLTVYVIIFLLATFGNALVIFVVYKTRELHTVTGFLIANLAVADLGVGMLCIPFTVVYFELNFHWPFGAVMCKLLPALMSCFVMGSVGTMLAISIDRHQSIVHPFGMRISRYQGKLIMLLIWLTALLPALPLLGVMITVPYPGGGVACIEDWPQTTGMPYYKIYLLCTFALTYTIPLPIMILIYIKIGIKLRQAISEAADRPGFTQAQATKRIIKMLAAVVVCYALCFLPFHTLYFMMDFGGFKSTYIYILQSYFQVLMYGNSATNPVLYAFLGDQFKKGFKRAIRGGSRRGFNPQQTMSTRMSSIRSR